jgi:hypothetical protein
MFAKSIIADKSAKRYIREHDGILGDTSRWKTNAGNAADTKLTIYKDFHITGIKEKIYFS